MLDGSVMKMWLNAERSGNMPIADKFIVGGQEIELADSYAREQLNNINSSDIFIDDNVTSADKVWSSEKVSQQLQSKVDDIELDGNILNIKANNNIKKSITLPTSSEGEVSTEYDTEVILPFTATKDTDVKLVLDAHEIATYNNLSLSGEDITQYVITKAGNPVPVTTIENTEKGNAFHYKNTVVGGYNQCQLFSQNAWDSTHYYYVSYWIKVVTKSPNYEYPLPSCGTNTIVGSDTVNLNSTEWQRISFITQPANYLTTGIGFNIISDGEYYFKPIAIIDLDGLGYDLSSSNMVSMKGATYISDIEQKMEQGSSGFACTVTNGATTEDVEAFTSGSQNKFYTVLAGTTLSVAQKSGYNLPSVTALVKGSSGVIQTDIDDVNIRLNTRFANRKVVFEGDSITDSDYLDAYNGKSWADYLATKLKMTIASNQALGGSSISTFNTSGSVVNRILGSTYPSDTKLFCIFAGTNDWNSNVELGEIDSTNTSTMLGALNTIIDHLQTNYPDAVIVIMTPMHRSGTRTAVRTAGTMTQVAEAYEKVCQNWGVNCVNTLKEFGMNAYNTTIANRFYCEQDANWLHPNVAGHKRIANRMAGYISTL